MKRKRRNLPHKEYTAAEFREKLKNKPTIELRKGVFIESVFVINSPGPMPLPFAPPHMFVNYMGCLLQADGGTWELRARFQFERDNLLMVEGSKDIRVPLDVEFPGATREEAIEATKEIIGKTTVMLKPMPDQIYVIPICKDGGDIGIIDTLTSACPCFKVSHTASIRLPKGGPAQ